MIDQLALEVRALIKSAIEISYFSRGAWSYEQVMSWSAFERDLAVEFVNERLKIAAKSSFPVY